MEFRNKTSLAKFLFFANRYVVEGMLMSVDRLLGSAFLAHIYSTDLIAYVSQYHTTTLVLIAHTSDSI